MKKRLLSILLTLTMVISLFPAMTITASAATPEASWAISDNGQEPAAGAYTAIDTLENAFGKASSLSENEVLYIKLLRDVNVGVVSGYFVSENKSVVFDLGGYEFAVSPSPASDYSIAAALYSRGNLTVKNGEITAISTNGTLAQAVHAYKGTLNISNCTIHAETNGNSSYAYGVQTRAATNISDSTITVVSPYKAYGIEADIYNTAMYLSETSVTASGNNTDAYGIIVTNSNASVFISGTKSISGTTADISLYNATKLYANDGLSTSYTGDKIDLVCGDPNNLPKLGDVVVYGVNNDNKDKFSLAESFLGESNELKMVSADDGNNLVIAEKGASEGGGEPTPPSSDDVVWVFGAAGNDSPDYTTPAGSGTLEQAFTAAKNNANSGNGAIYIKLQKDVTLTTNYYIGSAVVDDVVIDLGTKKLTFVTGFSAIQSGEKKLTLKNGSIDITVDGSGVDAGLEGGGTGTIKIDGVDLKITSSGYGIAGGSGGLVLNNTTCEIISTNKVFAANLGASGSITVSGTNLAVKYGADNSASSTPVSGTLSVTPNENYKYFAIVSGGEEPPVDPGEGGEPTPPRR